MNNNEIFISLFEKSEIVWYIGQRKMRAYRYGHRDGRMICAARKEPGYGF
ncbi:hypothetical protein CBFG_02384 [Clostridiales bacterium 1_7_47FAA]|nr:hypothetical protein CBFG_02384 [Clostridiales bacterium 1_7_47FAA]